MSTQAFIDFCAKASENPELEAQITNVDALNNIVELGAANGFTFSEEDVKNGATKLNEMDEQELSEEQLTSVSGGFLGAVIGAIKVGIFVYKMGKKAKWWWLHNQSTTRSHAQAAQMRGLFIGDTKCIATIYINERWPKRAIKQHRWRPAAIRVVNWKDHQEFAEKPPQHVRRRSVDGCIASFV
jgi:predicted ribosomally synthesized peptide with nif11-like leader